MDARDFFSGGCQFVPFAGTVLRKFQCVYCYKTLSSKQNYKEHIYIHTGEKPFKCTEPGCEESFRQGSQLSVHRKMHRQVLKLQSRTSIQIPKVSARQLTDMLEAEWKRMASTTPAVGNAGGSQVLPDIKAEQSKDVKLPNSLFFME